MGTSENGQIANKLGGDLARFYPHDSNPRRSIYLNYQK
jgi:hypothetical protein